MLIPRTKGRFSSTGIDKVGLVTSTGAKTGQHRTHPLVLIDDGDGLLAIGSNYDRAPAPGLERESSWPTPGASSSSAARRRPTGPSCSPATPGASAWTTAVDFYAGYERYCATSAPRRIRLFRLRPVT